MARSRLFSLLLLLTMLVAPVFASVDEVRLHVRGLACPFCVFGIEKNLKKVPGVASLETTIREGLVRIQMDPKAALDVKALDEAVRRSGFTPAGIEATVTGRLTLSDSRPVLESSRSGQIFLLVDPGAQDSGVIVRQETLERMRKKAAGGSGLLSVSGHVHGHVEMSPALSIESFEAQP